MTDIYRFLIAILAVWRITHLLHAEDGPWRLAERSRDAIARLLSTRVFDCFYCLSLWVALPFAWLLAGAIGHRLLLWPALSAGAILIERITDRDEIAPAPYLEGGLQDELLRTREDEPGRGHHGGSADD